MKPFIFGIMLAFSLFFIFIEKSSMLHETRQSDAKILLSPFYESYGKYYFYYREKFGKEMHRDKVNLKRIAEGQNSSINWLKLSLLMKAVGDDKEALKALESFKLLAEGDSKINEKYIMLISNMVSGNLDKNDVSPAIEMTEKLNLGWYGYIGRYVIFRGTGLDEIADNEKDIAIQKASVTVRNLFILSTVFLLALFAGVTIIISVLRQRKLTRQFDGNIQYRLSSANLFETFILWIFLVTLSKVVLTGSEYIVNSIRLFETSGRILVTAGVNIFPFISLLYIFSKIRRHEAPPYEIYFSSSNVGKDIYYGFGGYVAILPLLVLSLILTLPFIEKLERILPTPPNPAIQLIASSHSLSELVLMFALVSIIAPVTEEIIFRGILQNAIKRRLGPWAGICGSAFIFSLLHPQLPLGFLPIMVLGIGFGIIAEARKSLVPSIIAHSTNNAVVFIVMLLLK